MSNMSYCRFENTSNDLKDCVYVMEDSRDIEDLDLSENEQDSIRFMKVLCENFLAEYNRLCGEFVDE